MPHSAHVLVAIGDEAARGRLAVMLADNGLRVSAAGSGATAQALLRELKPDVVVLGAAMPDGDPCALGESIKAMGTDAEARVVVIAPHLSEVERKQCMSAGIDDIVEGPVSEPVLLARLRPLCRLATMQAELRRRRAVAHSLGIALPAANGESPGNAPCRVMLVAKPGSRTDRDVRSALNGGFALTVEGDPYRAGAKVESERFDAMVLSADGGRETAEPVLYLSSHLRNNPSLFNLPVMMLSAGGTFADGGEPYRHGASIALDLPFEQSALAAGIQVLVRRQRLRWSLREAYRAVHHELSPRGDVEIYPERFFKPYLKLSVEEALRDARHLSVAVFSLRNLPDIQRKFYAEAGELLLAKAASWITGLVRTEDLVARLGDDELCVVLPDTAREECLVVAQRIVGILSNSEFNLTEEVMQPIRIWVDGGCASLQVGDDAESLLARARASMF